MQLLAVHPGQRRDQVLRSAAADRVLPVERGLPAHPVDPLRAERRAGDAAAAGAGGVVAV